MVKVGTSIAAVFLLACAGQRAAPPATPPPAPPMAMAAPPVGDPTLFSTLWQQTSAEYRASAWQAYRTARAVLPVALADSGWTAAVEQ
jgi:hypothetical protein